MARTIVRSVDSGGRMSSLTARHAAIHRQVETESLRPDGGGTTLAALKRAKLRAKDAMVAAATRPTAH